MTTHDHSTGGSVGPSGGIAGMSVHHGRHSVLLTPDEFYARVDPDLANDPFVAEWRGHNETAIRAQFDDLHAVREFMARRTHSYPILVSELWLKAVVSGRDIDLGLASLRVVTDTGVGFVVDAWQNIVELENMKFHGTGSGTTAESAGQSALVTEFTTQLNPDNTRATGTLEEAAANIFKTVATNTYDATVAVTEHGLFSQAATGGGVMFDRSVFSAVNLVSGDSLATDYRATLASGG